MLIFYIILIPIILLHWIFNDDACCLTLIEQKFKKNKNKNTFMEKLISPIYKFPNNNTSLSKFSYIILIILWLISLINIILNYKTNEF